MAPDAIEGRFFQVHDEQSFTAGKPLFEDIAGRIDHHGVSGEGKTIAVFAGLVGGDQKEAVVKGPGRKVTHPGSMFLSGIAPRRSVGDKNYLCPLGCHCSGQFREMSIVAELDAELDAGCCEHRNVASRAEHTLFRRGDMQLSVNIDPTILMYRQMAGIHDAAGTLFRHPGHNDHARRFGHPMDPFHLRAVDRQGNSSHLRPVAVSGDVQLRETNDLDGMFGGGFDKPVHPIQVVFHFPDRAIHDHSGNTNIFHVANSMLVTGCLMLVAGFLSRIDRLKRLGIIRRIGGNFVPGKLGFVSTLCAAKVPEDKVQMFADTVNQYPGVTHNYLRENEYNVWFTFISPSMEEIEDNLKKISMDTGITDILNLPATKVFKINAQFNV